MYISVVSNCSAPSLHQTRPRAFFCLCFASILVPPFDPPAAIRLDHIFNDPAVCKRRLAKDMELYTAILKAAQRGGDL